MPTLHAMPVSALTDTNLYPATVISHTGLPSFQAAAESSARNPHALFVLMDEWVVNGRPVFALFFEAGSLIHCLAVESETPPGPLIADVDILGPVAVGQSLSVSSKVSGNAKLAEILIDLGSHFKLHRARVGKGIQPLTAG